MMNTIRKTKIVCTMGPAVEDPAVLKSLLTAGMNVARLNYAHGDHGYHREIIKRLRHASAETQIPVAILADVKGPEIRTGDVPDNKKVQLVTGNTVIVTTDIVPCTGEIISVSYKKLPGDVIPGTHIRIADGIIDLEVIKVEHNQIHCTIKNGGMLGSHKNVNVIGVKTTLPAITEKDVRDIMFSIENQVDFIAASFIRHPDNVREIRSIIEVADAKIDIIAKIEDREGVDNIDEIIRASDGIMVARGDLGVQLCPEEIPLVQKRIIQKCKTGNKPVITATQMLDSMINNPIPTRAEVTDVANAVIDGTDAVMLSGETSIGKYPLQAVTMMHKIALQIENSCEYQNLMETSFSGIRRRNISDSVAGAAFLTAHDLDATAILTPSLHGNTPKIISRFRPEQYIIAATPYPRVQRNLLLYWGVESVICEIATDSDTMVINAIAGGEKAGLIQSFDKLVILAGIPVDSPIMLNTVRIHLHCRVLAKSQRGYGDRVSGTIVKVGSLDEAKERLKGREHCILLTKYMGPEYLEIMELIDGYILEEFSSMSIEEIHKYNPGIVALAKTRDALSILEDGQLVTIDGNEKLIYQGMPNTASPAHKRG
jgi:pyruvate kinase